MTKLWILLAVSLVLARLIDRRDRTLDRRGSRRKERLVTWLLIIVLAFFCGLRTKGNDTGTYINIYLRGTPTIDVFFAGEMPDFADAIGFQAMNAVLKTLNFSAQDFLLFYAFVTTIPYVLFVRRYSESMVFGVFLMFTTGFYTFSLAAIKQCVATGICLMALNYALGRKWLKYSLLVGLASLFHPYAIVYFLVPLMMFRPWTLRTFIYMILFMLAGFCLELLLGTVLDITDMMGADYTEESFRGEGVNVFRLAVSFVPIIMAAVYGKKLFSDSSVMNNLMFNLAMLNALIMFVGLFGTANYFARLANFFLPAQVIVLPWLLRKVNPRDSLWLHTACVVGYLGYFFYENAIARSFDSGYAHTSFWKYLVSLF